MRLHFTVIGVAQPMGSKRAFVPKGWTRPIITDTNRSLKSWQQLVAEGANHAIQQLPASERTLLVDGVRLTAMFHLPRPKTLPRRRTAHCTTPDVDKCARALLDALAGVVFRNDAQVCALIAVKRYAAAGEVPHVDISVEPCAGGGPVLRDQPLFDLSAVAGHRSGREALALGRPVPHRDPGEDGDQG